MLKTFLIGVYLVLNICIPVFASDNIEQDRICRNYHLDTVISFTEVRHYQNKQKLEKARKSAQNFQGHLSKMRKACDKTTGKMHSNFSKKIEEYNNYEQKFVKSGLLDTSSI